MELELEQGSLEKRKILLHTCCAVCFGYPSQLLKMLHYDVTAYFYNPNIHPEEEFLKRKEELERICEKYEFGLITEDYTPEDFREIAQGLEDEPEQGARCAKCFELRLTKTAKKAKELGFASFSTTLTVSAHKISEQIFEAGELAMAHACGACTGAQETTGVTYEAFDFKKNNGVKITQEIARFNELYRQDYCGCEFSLRRQTKKTPPEEASF